MDLDLAESDDVYCAEMARAAAEPLYGTAVYAQVWFLLEVNQPWSAQATNDNQLPGPVQRWLDERLAAGPRRRLQFIRQPGNERPDGLAFYVALAHETAPALYAFHLETYEALLEVDVEAVIRQEARFRSRRLTSPLFLVCTNGKRDRCCARFGAAFYQALSAQVGPAAWQTTHLGGHRFAATALLLPQGLSYGWLSEADIPTLLACQQQGHLYLEKLRGRVCYETVTQTADYFLRQATGRLALNAFQHLDTQRAGELAWVVTFATADGQTHAIRLAQASQPQAIVASCGPAKTKERYFYILEG